MASDWKPAFAERPEVFAAWVQLNTAIKARMDLRRYELATLAAARRLRSSYCRLAHGKVLQEQFAEPVREIARDHRSAGLDAVDVAVMDLAERVVDDASSIDDADLRLCAARALGRRTSWTWCSRPRRAASSRRRLTRSACFRCELRELQPELLDALVVGRPIAEASVE